MVKNSSELCRKPVMTKTKTPVVKKETISVKTFKAGKTATYLQCSNAYSPEHPHCTIRLKMEKSIFFQYVRSRTGIFYKTITAKDVCVIISI